MVPLLALRVLMVLTALLGLLHSLAWKSEALGKGRAELAGKSAALADLELR
ncbi:MAG: hypothetical protein JO115_03410 [Pseudonocardiales bacterium]|nr:hypothetical protein [Pseudonocardiales bacterium]